MSHISTSGMLTNEIGKLKISELFFEVPADYSKPAGASIQLFARSVTKHEKPLTPPPEEEQVKAQQKPWFVYLQGGPGCSVRRYISEHSLYFRTSGNFT